MSYEIDYYALCFVLYFCLTIVDLCERYLRCFSTAVNRALPQNSTMIATNVTSPFMTPFKLSLVTAIFLSVPFILYQIWGFLAPALYKNEQRAIFPLLIISTILFYCGVAFAYFVVAPMALSFYLCRTCWCNGND